MFTISFAASVAERGRVVGDARHCAAEDAQLDGGDRGSGGFEVLEDRLPRSRG